MHFQIPQPVNRYGLCAGGNWHQTDRVQPEVGEDGRQ